VIHCFTGSVGQARVFLDLGFHLAFGGILTFPKSEGLRDVLAYAPEDRILFETDAPYLAPVPKRGRRNEPALVARVYEEAARVRGVALEALAERVEENYRVLFPEPGEPRGGSRICRIADTADFPPNSEEIPAGFPLRFGGIR
jgi:TatD DNase family protein